MSQRAKPGPLPPGAEDVAELLAVRHRLPQGERLRVKVETAPLPRLELILDARPYRYVFSVAYLRGAGGRGVWDLVADALDNLFGMFLESERAHRDLPQGDDVEFDGAVFRVEVSREHPELDRQAEVLLEKADAD